MSQVVLEFSNREDLTLLLSFAKRLNAHIVSVKSNDAFQPINKGRAMLQQAANDPLFLADIAEVTTDFQYSDNELL
jgi:hypothetical protein